MTLESMVRVKDGFHKGKIGTVQAISDNTDYMIDFRSKPEGPIQGSWISGLDLEMIG